MLVKSTLFRLLGEILVFVILKLPTTELDLKWKFQFKTLLRFWFKFQLARHGYWRPGSPKASPDQLWEQLLRPGQPGLFSWVDLGKTRGGLPWKQWILPGWRRLRPTQTWPQWFKHGRCRAGWCWGWRSCRSWSWRPCQLLWLKGLWWFWQFQFWLQTWKFKLWIWIQL